MEAPPLNSVYCIRIEDKARSELTVKVPLHRIPPGTIFPVTPKVSSAARRAREDDRGPKLRQREHDAAVIARALDRLITEGADGSFLTVGVDEAYVQFLPIGDRAEPWLYCEAVSNRYLPDDQRLAPEQVTALTLLGFEETLLSPNYIREFRVPDTDFLTELGRMTVQVFATIYRRQPDSELDIDLHIEEAPPALRADVP